MLSCVTRHSHDSRSNHEYTSGDESVSASDGWWLNGEWSRFFFLFLSRPLLGWFCQGVLCHDRNVDLVGDNLSFLLTYILLFLLCFLGDKQSDKQGPTWVIVIIFFWGEWFTLSITSSGIGAFSGIVRDFLGHPTGIFRRSMRIQLPLMTPNRWGVTSCGELWGVAVFAG